MDIPALSMSMAQHNVETQFGVAMLAKSLDLVEESGDAMVQMMEQSVNPNLGSNIDVCV